ncbi:MAG: hypothetical protein H6825_01325 [Planctomycetes bacterium]|nr:hypothetical protein [Planctomycetota bacterium]
MSAKDVTTARELRELCVRAYHRELAGELHELERVFAAWRQGDADAVDVRDAVATFHEGEVQHLRRLYDTCTDERLVARAVARGFVGRDELSPELTERLEGALARVQRIVGRAASTTGRARRRAGGAAVG